MAKKIIGVIAVICGGIGIGVLVKKIVDKKRKETNETIKENREAEQLKEALAENEEMNSKLFGKRYVEIKTE
jgi:F0F1-type ATP synthase membrane subunit c/vacuolar-type H+-ATPase subunit K